MSDDEIPEWLEAVEIFKNRQTLKMMDLIPFASLEFKDAGRAYNSQRRALQNKIEFGLGLNTKTSQENIDKNWELIRNGRKRKNYRNDSETR